MTSKRAIFTTAVLVLPQDPLNPDSTPTAFSTTESIFTAAQVPQCCQRRQYQRIPKKLSPNDPLGTLSVGCTLNNAYNRLWFIILRPRIHVFRHFWHFSTTQSWIFFYHKINHLHTCRITYTKSVRLKINGKNTTGIEWKYYKALCSIKQQQQNNNKENRIKTMLQVIYSVNAL